MARINQWSVSNLAELKAATDEIEDIGTGLTALPNDPYTAHTPDTIYIQPIRLALDENMLTDGSRALDVSVLGIEERSHFDELLSVAQAFVETFGDMNAASGGREWTARGIVVLNRIGDNPLRDSELDLYVEAYCATKGLNLGPDLAGEFDLFFTAEDDANGVRPSALDPRLDAAIKTWKERAAVDATGPDDESEAVDDEPEFPYAPPRSDEIDRDDFVQFSSRPGDIAGNWREQGFDSYIACAAFHNID